MWGRKWHKTLFEVIVLQDKDLVKDVQPPPLPKDRPPVPAPVLPAPAPDLDQEVGALFWRSVPA